MLLFNEDQRCALSYFILFCLLKLVLLNVHFFLFWPPCGLWSSWARHQIQAAVVTYCDALYWSGDRTRVLVLQRCRQAHCATAGTPEHPFLSWLLCSQHSRFSSIIVVAKSALFKNTVLFEAAVFSLRLSLVFGRVWMFVLGFDGWPESAAW